jgi:hypothetical protein
MQGVRGKHTVGLTDKGAEMIRQPGPPFDMQTITRLIEAPRPPSTAALNHAAVMAVMLGQGMQNHIMLTMPAHGEDQTKIGPFDCHGKGLPEIG